MKAKEGFNLRDVCGHHIIVAEGVENIDFNNIIKMNDSSSLLWERAQQGDFTLEDLAQLLMDNYEIDDDTPPAPRSGSAGCRRRRTAMARGRYPRRIEKE